MNLFQRYEGPPGDSYFTLTLDDDVVGIQRLEGVLKISVFMDDKVVDWPLMGEREDMRLAYLGKGDRLRVRGGGHMWDVVWRDGSLDVCRPTR